MKSHRIVPACAAAMALFALSIATPANPQATPKRRPRVAVMDFDYATVQTASAAVFGTNVDIGKGIGDLLVTDLVKDGSYSVIERKQLDKILAEQNFSNSNRADSTSAAKIGKILGVDAIIVGSITEFGNETKKTGLGGAGGNWHGYGLGNIGHSNSKANVALTARIINVDTAEILGIAEDADGLAVEDRLAQPVRFLKIVRARQHQPAGRGRQLERLWRRERGLRQQQFPADNHR